MDRGKIKEKGFDLSYIALTENQFEKLDKMGVYGGGEESFVLSIS